MIRIVQEKIQPIKIAISGLNSQHALARAKWRNLVFEQFGLNKVKFGLILLFCRHSVVWRTALDTVMNFFGFCE